jgi:hypothetical protein
MSAKPICVVKVIFESIRPRPELRELSDAFADRMPDYHVFVVPQEDRQEYHDVLEFQVFYEKDQIPIDYEGLKAILLDLPKSDA